MRQVDNRQYSFQTNEDHLHFVAGTDRERPEAWRWDEAEPNS